MWNSWVVADGGPIVAERFRNCRCVTFGHSSKAAGTDSSVLLSTTRAFPPPGHQSGVYGRANVCRLENATLARRHHNCVVCAGARKTGLTHRAMLSHAVGYALGIDLRGNYLGA